MTGVIYLTGFPGPAGTLDYPTLGRFPIDIGVDPLDLQASRGLAYLLRASPINPTLRVTLKGPPFPAGAIDYPTPFQVEWAGAQSTIFPAASIGRSTAPDDTPADTWIPGALKDAPVNYQTKLFDGIEPTPKGEGGVGAIILVDMGALDSLIGLAWDGAPLDVLRGPPYDPFSTYEVVARLTTAGIAPFVQRKEIRLRDLGWQFENSDIHDLIYGGAGGLDGDASLAGHAKPYGAGPLFNISPTLINATLGIYQLSCTSILGVDDARDGGASLAFDTDYPTYEALAAATVAPASYATCLANGLIRLGSTIVYALTCDFRGDNDTINGKTYPHTRGQIARRIATGRGTVRLSDASIDFAALNKLDQAQPATVGFYWPEGISKADALTEVMSGCLGWWRVRLNGLFAVGSIDEPDGSPALTLNFPEDFAGEPEPVDAYQPPRRATYIGWGRNYTVQDASRLSGLVIDQGDALIYGQASRYSGVTDSFQAVVWPTSPTARIDGGYELESDASIEASRQQRVMGVRRERWLIKAPCDPFADLLGRVIQVNNFPRYGWGASRKFICVGQSFATGRATTLECWG
jgi:hypothetical protein